MYRRSLLGLILATGLSLPFSAHPIETPQKVSRFTWKIADERFGGFSGLEIEPDGIGFLALSDRGFFLDGRFLRDADGNITGIEPGAIVALKPEAGKQWPRWGVDSEGLAVDPDGTIYVSTEGIHTVFRFANTGTPPVALVKPHLFDRLMSNSSLESLAIGPDGALYTLPERSGNVSRPFPVFRYQNGAWDSPYSLPRLDEFLPVGLDFGPDGAVYLLERQFSVIRGFSSRVRRFELGNKQVLTGEVIFESSVGEYGNLEGITAWRDSAGRIRLTLISDDNFNFLQSTEIVEYVLPNDRVAPMAKSR